MLFETWEETGKITLACKKAHVSRGLFYYWKARFDEKGYAGLEEYESREAHKLNKKEESIEQKVIEMKLNDAEKKLFAELASWELGHASYCENFRDYYQDHGMHTED